MIRSSISDIIIIIIYPAGKAVFRHCGIELEGVPLVSVPLCDETCMHAPMHRCTVLPLWCSQWSQQEMDEQQATYGSTRSEDIAAISEDDSADGWSQVPSSWSASERGD